MKKITTTYKGFTPPTLDELKRIKGTVDGSSGMLPVLRGIYHIRVEYPDDPKSPSA